MFQNSYAHDVLDFIFLITCEIMKSVFYTKFQLDTSQIPKTILQKNVWPKSNVSVTSNVSELNQWM